MLLLLFVLARPLSTSSAVASARAAMVPPAIPVASLLAPDAPLPPDPRRPGPYPVGVTYRGVVRPSTTTGEPRRLDTVIWYPATPLAGLAATDERLHAVPETKPADGGPFPVLIFSHGANSTPTQSAFLTAHLASHGFIVAAPSHPGSTFEDCLGCGDAERMQQLLADSVANRPDDVSATLDMLTALGEDARSPFDGRVDATRAGVLGHSWGGYTAVMAAAMDPRFGAAVAMAPVVTTSLLEAAPDVGVPVLVMGGRLDDVAPYAPQERLFHALPETVPRALVTFPLGGHTAYSEVCPEDAPGCRPGELAGRAHTLVDAFVLAFLRVYLLNDDRYAPVLAGSLAGDDAEVEVYPGTTAGLH